MFRETVLSRSLRLMYASGVILGAGAMGAAHAQTAEANAAQMQRIEITGSSIKRAQVEGALPVQTVSREDIVKSGATSTEQLLNTLTANSMVGGNNVAKGVGTATYGESNASLRGIGASKTLVLVNGRRLANFATDGTAVDVNAIPLAIVDHVEILKDGASGVYGSDAIGGVINFITRQNFNGVEVSGFTSGTKDGGGAVYKASVIAGFGDYDKDRYNLTLSLDVNRDNEITGSQRGYAGTSWNNNGLRDGSATPSGAVRTFDPLANTAVHALETQGDGLGNPLYNPVGATSDNCSANGSGLDTVIGTCRYNPSPLVPLVPQVERRNIAGSLRFKLDESNELYVEGFHAHQLTDTTEQPSPYSVSFMASDLEFARQNVYPAIIMQPTSPFYPKTWLTANAPDTVGKPITVSYRAFDGGGRIHKDTANQWHLVTGAKGVFKGFDYDMSYVHNESSVAEDTFQGYQSQVAVAKLLSNNNAFNPWAAVQTPALAAQIFATNYNGPMMASTLSNDALNLKFGGELFKLDGGMALFSAGAAVANEKLDLSPSAAYQSGDISGYDGQALPLSASRHQSSLFGEFAFPILKQLEIDAAVRTDRFPNATSTNPKASFTYRPMAQLLVRGSAGKGFREPSLPELHSPQTFGSSASFVDKVTGVLNQWSVLAGGNPNLEPEKSTQAGLGIVVDPVKGLSFSLDYWKIKVDHLITTLSPQFIVAQAADGNAAYTPLVQRDSGHNITRITATNLNAGGVDTAGVDVDLKWNVKLADMGSLTTHLNGTYLSKFDMTLPDGSVQPSIGASIIDVCDPSAPGDRSKCSGNNLNAVANGGILFRWRHSLSFDWKFKDYGLGLTQNYQSGYQDGPRGDCSSCLTDETAKVGAFQTWDLQGSYSGIPNLTLRAGIKNLTNKKPPEAITLGQYFQSGYDPSYYDPHGMTVHVNATYKF
ncbi:MAG: TonB-dependent receptor [Pseudomonadota bacterium]